MCNMQKLSLMLVVALATLYSQAVAVFVEESTEECTCKNSYLWKVEAEPPVYLYGTLHVPYTKMWNRIPLNQKTAFVSSGSLLTELDLTDSKTLKRLTECQFLPEGQDLYTILPIDVYQRVEAFLERIKDLFLVWLKRNNNGGGVSAFLQQTRDKLFHGITYNWHKRRPIWLLFLLDSLNENMIKYRSTPIFDTFLDNAANSLAKNTQGIENVADHCRPLNNLKQDEVIIALRKKLDYLEPLVMENDGPPSSEDNYIKTYFCGNFEHLVQTTDILPLPSLSNMTNLSPHEASVLSNMNEYLKKQIVFRRNRKMSKAIINILNDSSRNESAFFAIGAGHFLGRKSIVDLLQKKNYTVTRVSVEQHIDGPELPSDIVALGDPSSVYKILNIPKEVVTPPPALQTLPPLTKEEISNIFREVLNNSKTYKVDSIEGSGTPPSSVSQPSSSPLTPTPKTQTAPSNSQPSYITTRSGAVLTVQEISKDDNVEPNSARNSKWSFSLTLLLVIGSLLIFTKLL